jgi:hypothetical protein
MEYVRVLIDAAIILFLVSYLLFIDTSLSVYSGI